MPGMKPWPASSHSARRAWKPECYMPGMLKSVFIRCAIPWASLCCLKPASLMFVTTVLQPTDLCHRQLRTGSDCRIPRPSHYMCRCPLKNEVYNNRCYSYSMHEMQMSGGVFCNLAKIKTWAIFNRHWPRTTSQTRNTGRVTSEA